MKGCDELLGLQDTLKALADPIRREILNLLKGGRLSAGEICEHFSVTGASISRHLAILKDADLIRSKREGKFIYYELNTSVLEDVMLWITDLKGFCTGNACRNFGGFYDGAEHMDKRVFCTDRLYTGDNHLL